MAVIHRTTLVPSKLELLTGWLPGQPWYAGAAYAGAAREPQLIKAGGFRLDDPGGEVGIEFLIARDGAGHDAAAYLVPMTYRGAELPGGQADLIGVAEHGVLGKRWIYDGTRDPVLVTQLTELIQGRAGAQAQSETDTPDLTVLSSPVPETAEGPLDLQFSRLLERWAGAGPAAGVVTGLWTGTSGAQIRSVLVTARRMAD